jgi:hypothetical protein
MSHNRTREENIHVSDSFADRLSCGIVHVSVTAPRQETEDGTGQDLVLGLAQEADVLDAVRLGGSQRAPQS